MSRGNFVVVVGEEAKGLIDSNRRRESAIRRGFVTMSAPRQSL